MKQLSLLVLCSVAGVCLGAGGAVSGSSGSGVGRYDSGGGIDLEYSGHHFVAVGDKFSITCITTVDVYPQWTFNGNAVIPGEAGFTLLEGHGTQGYVVSRLSVVQAHTFHAGEYKCSPLTDKTHSVYVIGGSVTETEGTRLLLEGSPLSLTCSQNLTNTDTVWSKDGKQVVEDENTKVFKNTTLYIVSAKVDDIGEYTCEHEGQDEPKVFNVVQLKLHKNLPESTTVLENDKLALSCQVEGNPPPTVQWLKNGELMEDSINSTRLIFSENEHNVPNASLLIKPILKSDVGNYICLVKQYSLQLNTTTEVRVKDIYAALWPFLAIVAEVIILCVIIFIYEKRRIKANFDDSDSDPAPDQKSVADHNKDAEVRQRK